jgi:hypothetical protein
MAATHCRLAENKRMRFLGLPAVLSKLATRRTFSSPPSPQSPSYFFIYIRFRLLGTSLVHPCSCSWFARLLGRRLDSLAGFLICILLASCSEPARPDPRRRWRTGTPSTGWRSLAAATGAASPLASSPSTPPSCPPSMMRSGCGCLRRYCQQARSYLSPLTKKMRTANICQV